jgi:hypothetical protein
VFGNRAFRALGIIGLGFLLSAAPLALADPPPGESCPASSPEQARTLAAELFEQGAYERAGDCYQAAGESTLAHRAFIKAVGPASAATARQLSDQSEQAKMMLRRVQRAFHTDH